MPRPLLRSLSLRHLVLMSTLGRELNLSRTAEILHTTQSALSRSLAQLEEMVGARLFNRTTKRMSLTPAGMSLLQRANRVLAEIELVQEDMAGLEHGGGGGEVRIGMLASLSPDLLGQALVRAREMLPKVDFSIDILRYQPLYESLMAGGIDVMLSHVEFMVDINAVDVREIYDEGFMVLVSRQHPLARRRSVTQAELASHPLVLPSIDTPLRSKLNRMLSVHRNGPPAAGRDMQTDSLPMALSLVRQAGLALFLARRYALQHAKDDSLRLLECTPQLLHGPICALTRREGTASKPARLLIECLIDLARQEPR